MGHLGVERVLHLMRERFIGPRMKRDIEHFVTRVCSCLKQRRRHVEPRAPMEHIHSSAPFEIVSLDFVHLERSSGGYEYIPVIVNHFTRFAQAYATKNKSARTAASKLYNDFIRRFGFPARILHDQGGKFKISCFTSFRKAVAWCDLEQHLTIHKETRKRNDLTKHSLPCCRHCPKLRGRTGKIRCTKWYMPIIVLGMRLQDTYHSSCCLIGRPDFQ